MSLNLNPGVEACGKTRRAVEYEYVRWLREGGVVESRSLTRAAGLSSS